MPSRILMGIIMGSMLSFCIKSFGDTTDVNSPDSLATECSRSGERTKQNPGAVCERSPIQHEEPKTSKMILAVLQGDDYNSVVNALNQAGFL